MVQKSRGADHPSLTRQRGATLVGTHAPSIKPATAFDPPEKPLNTYDFAVCDHVVRLMLKHSMDVNKVIDELQPNGTPFSKGAIKDQLETDVRIKTALQRDLSKLGLDDKAKEHYITEIWRWFKNESDPRLRATAARILGKAFVAERVETTAIESLPILGFEEGITRMLGSPTDCSAQHPEPKPIPEGGSE